MLDTEHEHERDKPPDMLDMQGVGSSGSCPTSSSSWASTADDKRQGLVIDNTQFDKKTRVKKTARAEIS